MTAAHPVPNSYHCPRCRAGFASSECLALHFRAHPECRAYASIARSLASIGFALCPRCRLALASSASREWTHDGFVHESCLSAPERQATARRLDALAPTENGEAGTGSRRECQTQVPPSNPESEI